VFALSPEQSQRERPEHQRLPQLELLPLSHDAAATEDDGDVESREEKRLLPVNTQEKQRSEINLRLDSSLTLPTPGHAPIRFGFFHRATNVRSRPDQKGQKFDK